MTLEDLLAGSTDLESVPSRSVLEAAERHTARVGHELDGFLSASHGFIPKIPTMQAFPPSHGPWDAIVAAMPELWRTVSLRPALRSMPVLDAGPADLPDEYVWRAASALAVFAHAYVYVEKLPAGDLPASVTVPWAQVAGRLRRSGPYMSYNDLIVYNHRLVDPMLGHTIDNMELLVPSVDNLEERRFYLAQVEILARGTPLVSSVVRAQEAASRHDDAALEAELLLMLQTWRDIAELSFRKVDPNPLSATHVDQVVWANSVAPLAVPIESGTPGPGGEASPIFHLMDAFLGRRFKESMLAKEVGFIRDSFPARQLAFLRAVDAVSVRDYVAGTGDRRLQSLWDTLFDAYAGKKGYLGIHRLKVYGFLELAFKVGRSITITHIEGGFKDRHWKTLDGILEETRTERYKELPPHSQAARLCAREATSSDGGVKRIVLDAAGTGVVYRPGDRCGVLTTNRPEAVERTLRALRASGEELVPLNARWRQAVRHRPEHRQGARTLPLRRFLAYARLRPVSRPMAKGLMDVAASPRLHDVVEAHLESQWELVDVLGLLHLEGYDVTRLWKAGLEQREALARIVPPEDFRMYSVASAPDGGPGGVSGELELTVAQLRYPGERGGELVGTASTYLSETTAGETFPIQLVRPSRFTLPRDPSRPIVMFAGGVGIAPFLGFVAQRERDGSTGANWLFYSTASRERLYCGSELAAAVGRGKLTLRVAFSREDGRLRGEAGGPLLETGGGPARIAEAIAADPEVRATLWELVEDGAFFYVCGRAGFAHSVMRALTAVAEEFVGGRERARVAVRQLVADGRYMQDVFTSWTPHDGPGALGDGVYDASEVALRTTPETGQWLTVNGEVYDMTEFLHLHPGGPRIVVENLGLDATREYEAVLHHENSEINAMLAMYKIGSIRRLDFGDAWGIALVPKRGLSVVSLHDLYRSWVRFMHLLTEMGNALANDWGYLGGAMTRDEDPNELNALKVQFASNTHQRFLGNYYSAALGEDVLGLWALTRGLCAPPDFARSLHAAISEAESTAEAELVRSFSEQFKTFYKRVDGEFEAVAESQWASLRTLIALVARQDKAFLDEAREIIRQGVIVFEQLEARTASEGGERLIAVLDRVPAFLSRWHREFVGGLDEIGWLPVPGEPVGSG
jgi:sulfite reductase alpha subunit-like flavoprotein/cytochrome b involved in lipid metabolism